MTGDAKTAKEDFKIMQLTEPEIKVWQALIENEACRFDPDLLDKDRTVRADILGKILRGDAIAGVKPPSLPRQVKLFGAIISGVLDMSDTHTGLTLRLCECRFDASPNFRRAAFASLDWASSEFKTGADFTKLETQGNLWCDGVKCEGEFSLSGANIGGQFSASGKGTRFSNPNAHALMAQGAEIKGHVFLHGAEITGCAFFASAKIGGFEATGKGTLFSNPNGDALMAQGVEIKGGVFLHGAEITGCAFFVNAKIGGGFEATGKGTLFSNPNGDALMAQGAEIKGGVFLDGAEITGCADFNSVKIGGQFSATGKGTRFSNPNAHALRAQGAEIKGGMFLRGAEVSGCAFFASAKIGGFEATGTRFSNPNGDALTAQSAEIKGEVFLTEFPHPPIGTVNFVNARLGHVMIDENSYPLGVLRLDGTSYANIDVAAKIGQAVPIEGWLRLGYDKKLGGDVRHKHFWQGYAPIRRYLSELPDNKTLSDDALSRKTLGLMLFLEQQNKDEDRSLFAYRQFARVLDAHGHAREARDIRIETEHVFTKRMTKGKSNWNVGVYKLWRFVIRHLIAYGLRPRLILGYMLVLWGLGYVVFAVNSPHMTPAKEKFYLTHAVYAPDGKTVQAYKEISPSDPLPKGYPDYSPFIYALDVMLPVVDFAQESHWRPKNREGVNCFRPLPFLDLPD